jgi:hypothetical protein
VQSSLRKNNVSEGPQDPRGPIESLPEFDWMTTKPVQYRPYKPKFHMTMGEANIDSIIYIL